MGASEKLPAYFVDTNVFIYSVGQDGRYRPACRHILDAVAEDAIRAVTSAEVIQEIAHRYKAIQRLEVGVALARQVMRVFRTVLPVARPDVEHMLDLVEQHPQISPRGALHIAVAQRAGIGTIVTADRHFRDIPGVDAIDPLELAEQLGADAP